jgi:hypothetical protein
MQLKDSIVYVFLIMSHLISVNELILQRALVYPCSNFNRLFKCRQYLLPPNNPTNLRTILHGQRWKNQ